SFGTAMANTAVRNGCDTMIWIRDEVAAAEINQTHVNKRYLPDFNLEPGLKAVTDLETAICNRDIILVAIPSHSFRDVLKQIQPFITSQAVISLTKGIEAKTFSFMSDIIREELPEVPYGVLSGPNLAKEIMAGQPARSEEHTSELQSRFDLVCRLLLEKNKRKHKAFRGAQSNTRTE